MPASRINTSSIELEDASLRFLETKSLSTRQAYTGCLKRFKYFYGDGLERFIEEIETERDLNEGKSLAQRVRPGEDTIRRFVKWHEEIGYAPKSTRQSIAALQNALKYYGIAVSFDFIELPPDRTLMENAKHQWKLDEVKQYVDTAKYLRDKAFLVVAFQSGLSISDILALNYGDIRREYEEGSLPLMIHTYRKKTGVELKTFLGRDAVHYLDSYLKTRGPLEDKSPLFAMLGSERRATKAAIQKLLRGYARKLKFIQARDIENGYNPARAHSLRSAFRSRLTGKMDDTLIEYFMGHSIGDHVKTYINMPPEDLRELYANYEHLLSIEKTSKDEQTSQDVPESFKRQLEEIQQENMQIQSELRTRIAEIEIKLLIATSKIETGYDTITSLEEKMDQLIQGIEKFIESQG